MLGRGTAGVVVDALFDEPGQLMLEHHTPERTYPLAAITVSGEPAAPSRRREFEALWKKENKRIDVTVTSAVELDPAVVEKIGQEVERQTGEEVDLSSSVDDRILGGIVLQVGNMVLDASIRSRLEKLRKSVAQAA